MHVVAISTLWVVSLKVRHRPAEDNEDLKTNRALPLCTISSLLIFLAVCGSQTVEEYSIIRLINPL